MPPEGDADFGEPDTGVDMGGDTGEPGGSAFGTDGGDGGDGGGGPASIQDIAAAVDAHLLKEGFGEGDVAGDGDDEGEGGADRTGRTQARRDAIDKFIELNYKGDADAFVKSLYESRSQNAKLEGEIRELRAKVEHPAPPPTPVDTAARLKEALAETPEYQAVHRESLFLENKLKSVSAAQTQRATAATKLDSQIAEQRGLLTGETDPTKLQSIQFKIQELRQDRTALNIEFNQAEEVFQNTQLHLNDRRRQLSDISAQVEAGLNHQSSSTKSEAAESARTNKHFDTAFAHHVKEYALNPKNPENAKTINRLYKAVRYELADHLTTRERAGDTGYDQYELSEVTSQILKDIARDFGVRPRQIGTRPPVVTGRVPSTRRPIVGPRPNTSRDFDDGNGRGRSGSKRLEELLTTPVGASREDRKAAADRVRKRSDILLQTAQRRSSGGRG